MKIFIFLAALLVLVVPSSAIIMSCAGIGSCQMNQTPNMTAGPQGPVGPENLTTSSHNFLINLTTSDDHSQYAYLPGRAGGQTLTGGTDSGNLVLNGSMNNGYVILNPLTTGVIIGRDTPISAEFPLSLYHNFSGLQAAMGLANIAPPATGVGSYMSFFGNGYTGTTLGTIGVAWNTTASTDAYMRFSTRGSNSNAERMRITSNGKLLIGTTSSPTNAMLDVVAGITFRNCSGTPTFGPSGQLICASDDKLKKDKRNYSKLAPLPKPIQYSYNDASGYDTQKIWTGFSAQDVEVNYPECVISRPDTRYETQCTGSGEEQDCNSVGIPTGTYTKSIDQGCMLAVAYDTITRQQAILDRICSHGNPSLCEA